jgi:hypothetical protein
VGVGGAWWGCLVEVGVDLFGDSLAVVEGYSATRCAGSALLCSVEAAFCCAVWEGRGFKLQMSAAT